MPGCLQCRWLELQHLRPPPRLRGLQPQTQEVAKQLQTQIQPQDQMQLQVQTQKRPVPVSEPDDMRVDEQAICVLFDGVEGLTSEQRGLLEDNAKQKLRRWLGPDCRFAFRHGGHRASLRRI